MKPNFRPGEWPCDRGDRAQSGHSVLRGRILQPQVAWTYPIGDLETLFVLSPGHSTGELEVPAPQAPPAGTGVEHPRWGLKPPSYAHNYRTYYARVSPGEEAPQRFEFESGMFSRTKLHQWPPVVGRCCAWRGGAWTQVWQSEPIEMMFQPLPLVGDFDACGEPEVAILPWRALMILDARTGKVKDDCPFTINRNYGFLGAYDLNGNGRQEFVILSDVSKHIDALGYREGRLALLWRHEIEVDPSQQHKLLRILPQPVQDVDGDGLPEVVVSLYNDGGDGRWHVVAYQGRTGLPVADLPDQFLQGLADVNGDGVAELMTMSTSGYDIPDCGAVALRSLHGGAVRTLWQEEGAAWQLWDAPLPPNVNSSVALGRQHVLCRDVEGKACLAWRRPRGEERTTVTVGTWGSGGLEPFLEASGPGLDGLALDEQGALLARCRTAPSERATLEVAAGRCQMLGSQPARSVPSAAVVAWPDGATTPVIVAGGAEDRLVVFIAPHVGVPARQVHRWRGRGQCDVWPPKCPAWEEGLPEDMRWPPHWVGPGAVKGPAIADLRGDGGRQCLFGTVGDCGWARLVAVELDGHECWHHDLVGIPGGPSHWNVGGLLYWQVGHFTNPEKADVLVTVRRGMMHSEETLLLSGEDGHEVWRRERLGIRNRAVGMKPYAVADFDSDGLDEAAGLWPSEFYILKGTTGANLLAIPTHWDELPTKHEAYWGMGIAGDWENTGHPQLLYATARESMTGLIRADGTLAWWDAIDESPQCLPAMGDIDGDGRVEAVGIGYCREEIRCYQAATGQIKWRLAVPEKGKVTGTASADVDSDGKDEVLFTIGRRLYCLGADVSRQSGQILWQIELPARVGPPAIADVDGSGKAVILLVGDDACVYCVR